MIYDLFAFSSIKFVLQNILYTSLVDVIKEVWNSQLTEPQQKDESSPPAPVTKYFFSKNVHLTYKKEDKI